jgi:hypothetical protein
VFTVSPLPAKADGGPIVDSRIWSYLKEGQQIAVITISDLQTAEVDLFISLQDKTGESHEVVFFVPLGVEATSFGVFEETSRQFDRSKTESLDNRLRDDAERKHQSIRSLFGATLLTNGVWLLPAWLPVIFSGCGTPPPEATFTTESSKVNIYGLDDNTDLEDLINTTGLDPSVSNTLSRLRGQRIAVVTLQTTPQGTEGSDGSVFHDGEPGIHLSWVTSLIEGESGSTYAYPMGTGDAWYHPIELTRVYVVTPPGIDFSVKYPRLGANRSGYTRKFTREQQTIIDYNDTPAYAVDEVSGDFGHIWRATYTQSNAMEDIIISVNPQSAMSKMLVSFKSAGNGGIAFLLGFILALACWLLGWRYLAPRLMHGYRGNGSELWGYAIKYTLLNMLAMLPGLIMYSFWSWTGSSVIFAFLLILFGGISIIYLAASYLKRLGVSARQAFKAYVVVTLAGNGVYFLLALAYAKLTSVV